MPKPLKTIRAEKIDQIDIAPLVAQVVNGDATEEVSELVRAAERYQHGFAVGEVKEFVAGVLYGLRAVDALADAQAAFDEDKAEAEKASKAKAKKPAAKSSAKKKS